MALRQTVHNLNLCDRFHEGIIHSKDAFYSEIPESGPDPLLEGRWEMWKKAGVLVTERMEISTIFVICQIRGLRAGGIMVAIGDTNEN
jgi:uridine phosphorylase